MPATLWSHTAGPALRKAAASDPQTFEASLATIGRSTLYAKAPAMAKHEIGFQVLDADDDNTRAVGVFGYRVGSRLLYVPLFYRDGVVKGTEQLRDPKRKITVPLSDAYVNKFLSETRSDAAGVLRPRSANRDTAQPSLWQLKTPPTKYAAAPAAIPAADLAAIRADLAGPLGRRPGFPAPDVDLVKAAAEHPPVLAALGRWAAAYPWFGDAVLAFHGREKLAAAVARAAELAAPAPPPRHAGTVLEKAAAAPPPLLPRRAKRAAALTVIRVGLYRAADLPLHHSLDRTAAERAELDAGRNAYRDARKEADVSKVTWLNTGHGAGGVHMSNPEGCGVYRVLDGTGGLRKCVVLTPLFGWGPMVDRCVVVDTADDSWCLTHRSAVWVSGEADHVAYRDWAEALPRADLGPVSSGGDDGKEVLFVGLDGVRPGWATVPFHAFGDGSVCCSCSYQAAADRPIWAPDNPYTTGRRALIRLDPREETAPKRATVLDTVNRPALSANHLYLPRYARRLSLGDKRFRPGVGNEPERLYLSRALGEVVKEAAAGRAGVVAVRRTGAGVVVDDPRTKRAAAFPDAPAAEAHLVEAHGLRVADARRLVDGSARGEARAAVKYADDYAFNENLPHDWPNAPAVDLVTPEAPAGFADDVVPSEAPIDRATPIPDLLMQPGAMDRYRPYPVEHGVRAPVPGIGNGSDPDPVAGGADGPEAGGPDGGDLTTVARSAATGRRELFDTAALASLVKHTKFTSLKSKVAPHLIKSVSGLGDLLAHLYWNIDEWAERFGESEVGPLEDQLRGAFESLGELYLTLQEKAVSDGENYGVLPRLEPGDGADAKD